MNKHIELVKKYLADNDSVSQQEIEKNAKSAYGAAYDAHAAAAAGAAEYDAADAAAAAFVAAYAAAYVDAAWTAAHAADAAHWVKRYEELTNE